MGKSYVVGVSDGSKVCSRNCDDAILGVVDQELVGVEENGFGEIDCCTYVGNDVFVGCRVGDFVDDGRKVLKYVGDAVYDSFGTRLGGRTGVFLGTFLLGVGCVLCSEIWDGASESILGGRHSKLSIDFGSLFTR